ncbi:MAG: IS4 family transposase [Gemmatimonadales bacterium]
MSPPPLWLVPPSEPDGVRPPPILDPRVWAEQTFGTAALGDRRRTRRIVATAAVIAAQPMASLPRQLRDPAALKAVYRLMHEPDVSCAALVAPHCAQTQAAAATWPVVLFVQDTSELDFTHHPKTTGLGPIGDGRGRGILLQTDLAVIPVPRQVLGIAYLEPFLRQPVPRPDETTAQRQQRARESDVWARAVAAIGAPPTPVRWVHVADRGADVFTFLAACQGQGTDFVVRLTQDRRVTSADGTPGHLLQLARALPGRDTRAVAVPARPARRGQPARPARTAQVAIAWAPLTVHPPTHTPAQTPIPGWVVRAWEPAPPPGEPEPLEWVLLTSVPTEVIGAAWERIDWYRCRWLVEDFHQCLKTGCRLEATQLRDEAALERVLGLLAPTAVRLLQGREAARLEPDRPAIEVIEAEIVEVVAARTAVASTDLTCAQFWQLVARLGGHQGRARDRPPGWRTIWHGWLYIQTLREGLHLAPLLTNPRCG